MGRKDSNSGLQLRLPLSLPAITTRTILMHCDCEVMELCVGYLTLYLELSYSR